MISRAAAVRLVTTLSSRGRGMMMMPSVQRMNEIPSSSIFKSNISTKTFDPEENRHRSDAEELINAVPVIEVKGTMTAVCDGGGGALGHPLEYIELNTIESGAISECKYCGLRFKAAPSH